MKTPGHDRYEQHFARALHYLQTHYNSDINLHHIAAAAGMSSWHWHRLYHSVMGETLHDTLKWMRLHRAAWLLCHTDKSIADIALACGYRGNAQSFTHIFRNYYKRAADSDMGFVAAYCNLGDMHLKMNDSRNALANYEKAADINPGYITAYLKIGSVYAQQGDYEQAVPLYMRALLISPDSDKANYLLATAYKHMGKSAEAAEYFKKAAERGSDEAVYELRKMLTERGKNVL